MLKWLMRTFAALALLAIVAVGIVGYEVHLVRAFAETPFTPSKEIIVHVPEGLGPRSVCEKFVKAGVVSDEELFYRNVRYIRRDAGRLKAGDYLFHEGVAQTPNDIIDRLLKGEVLSVKVTIAEGLRLDEQAQVFEAAGVGKAKDFIRLARDKKFASSVGVDANSLEGYLFPDTYSIPKNWKTEQVLKQMVERFNKAWDVAEAQRAPDITLNKHQAVTLASIVEKETGNPEERPRISCVFHNRLRKHIKLQTDPTIIYGILMRDGSFDGNIHKSDLETPTPYNTYTIPALPPGPIANPGAAALNAALNPIKCDDLFFVSKNNGTHVFCPDLACHEANVQKWQRDYFAHKRKGN